MARPANALVALILLVMTLAPGAARAADEIGQVVQLSGAASATRDDRTLALRVGSVVYRGDAVATYPGGRVQIELKDGSLLAVGENSRLSLTDYVERQGDRGISAVIELFLGIVRATLPRGPNRTFDIRTNVAIASARSTDWVVDIAVNQTSILVTEGQVSVRALAGAWQTVLGPGFGLDIRDPTAVSQPRKWGAGRVARTLERVRLR